MRNMTNRTKKNISGNNSYNNTLKPDLNQRKYFMKIIVTVVYFMLIYSQSIILCGDPDGKKNSQLTKSNSPNKYCRVTVEADSFRTKLLVTVFVEKPCVGNSKEESYYELIDHVGHIHEGGLVQLYNDEQEGSDIMYELLNHAKDFLVDKYTYKDTSLVFSLTAGLRLLKKEKSDEIVNKVKNILSDYEFSYTVVISKGSREGVYAWLTVNFMKNNLKDFDNTIAILDLRDSFLHIIFYVPQENLKYYEERFKKIYHIMDIDRVFYKQSHLGFGLMEMRIKMLKMNSDNSTYSSPCHLTSDNFSYTYLFENYKITGSSPINDIYTQCFTAVQSLITKNVNKVTIKQPIMAISFFYETAKVANLVRNTEECITNEDFNKAAIQCFSQAFDDSKPFNCFDLVYIHVLLSQLIDFGDNPSITVKKYDIISEISWALGAAYQKLPKIV